MTLVEDKSLPWFFDSLEDIDQPTDLKVISPNDAITLNTGQEIASGMIVACAQRCWNENKATETLENESKSQIQPINLGYLTRSSHLLQV